MKKLLTIVLALALALSLVACGGSKPTTDTEAPKSDAAQSTADKPVAKAEAAPAKAETTTPKAATPKLAEKPDLENPEYTPEQLAVAKKFADMTDSFQALADKISADENLMAIPELVDTMNTLIDAVNEDDALFVDPKNLSDEVLQNLEEDIEIGYGFIKEIEAMLKNYEGKTILTVPVEIVNDTGVDIHGLAMSPANDNDWGADLLDAPLAAGESGTTQMTFTEDSLVWDLLTTDSEGTELTFMGIDFSQAPTDGATLLLTVTEGGEYMAEFAQ